MLLNVVTNPDLETYYHRLVGNMNGDMRLDSADAILLLRLANGQPINPLAGDLDDYDLDMLSVTIPSMDAYEGSLITMPLSINEVESIAGVDVVVSWPETELQLQLMIPI